SSGSDAVVTESYRSRVIGSEKATSPFERPHPHDVPQHVPFSPETTRRAASPYFCRTTAFTSWLTSTSSSMDIGSLLHLAEECAHLVERFRHQGVIDPATVPSIGDDAGILQLLQVEG